MSTGGVDPHGREHAAPPPVDPVPVAPDGQDDAAGTAVGDPSAGRPKHATGSKTSAAFVFSALGAVVLLLLLIFILQNLDQMPIEFLGLKGSVPVGVALLLAAVAGALLVGIFGGLRIIQLRRRADRWRR